jgi:hypothetical protein
MSDASSLYKKMCQSQMVKSCSRLFKVSVQIYEASSCMFHFQIINCELLMDTSLTDSPTGKSHAFKSSLMNKKSLHRSTQNIWGSIPNRVAALLPQSTLPVQKLLFICQPKKFHAFYKNQNFLYPQQQSATQHPHILLLEHLFSSHLCCSSQSKLFPSGFQTKIVCAILISSIHATCSSHLVLLNLFTTVTFCEKH